ncbi:hypothetical protein C1T31_11705 [Hanstruepera neustonica]|uniref:Uncharacterized protein n=1 Tax=Hanstruepera neustonica TaxID=1445657 RepID=A0A2K1DWQ1_9FLAO|nr:hypothetical protein [Hanstruepera neustonica]PNQ72451.1 hypothetical protein C1T31_11705 [Hanstruepera neustonica]
MVKKVLFSFAFSLIFLISFSQVGIGTTTPLSTLDINGNFSVKVVNLTGDGNGGTGTYVDIDDGVYISVSPQATDDEFRLPDATMFPGRVYIIRNIQDTVTAKISTSGGLLFSSGSTTNGATAVYLYEYAPGNDYKKSIIVLSDGANWTYFFGLF